jgi:hypothetical protein
VAGSLVPSRQVHTSPTESISAQVPVVNRHHTHELDVGVVDNKYIAVSTFWTFTATIPWAHVHYPSKHEDPDHAGML